MINIAYASGHIPATKSFLLKITNVILQPFLTFLIALAAVLFLWGVAEFIIYSDDESKRTSGKSHMIWGIVGLVIMTSAITILQIVLNTFNISLP